jgi:hypothetical protein
LPKACGIVSALTRIYLGVGHLDEFPQKLNVSFKLQYQEFLLYCKCFLELQFHWFYSFLSFFVFIFEDSAYTLSLLCLFSSLMLAFFSSFLLHPFYPPFLLSFFFLHFFFTFPPFTLYLFLFRFFSLSLNAFFGPIFLSV